MKVQHHVYTLEPGLWPRGRDVSLEGDQIRLRWTMDHSYDLVEAYPRFPHLRFLKCKTDQELVSFVTSWGPLNLTAEERVLGTSSMAVNSYRVFQRWLKAVVSLIDGFKNSREERQHLQEFLAAELACCQESLVKPIGNQSEMGFAFRQAFGITEDTTSWIERTDLQRVRAAAGYILSITPFVRGAGLECGRKEGKPHVEARWSVDTLEDAFRWMVWQDEFIQHPLLFCRECSEPFRALSKHRRKYCSPECGHRVAARKWRTEDLQRKREIRGKSRKG
jgi:hypothetical protein